MGVFLCISIKDSWRSKDNGVISGGQEKAQVQGLLDYGSQCRICRKGSPETSKYFV